MSLNETTVTLPLAQLVEDMDLYPRHAVDPAHVSSLVGALESGATLPPLVADKKSKRITDGWHRARAYKRVLGNTATVDVVLINYPNEAAMIFDAAHRNAAHGRRLDTIDKTRCIMMMRTVGLNDDRISLALNIPNRKVEKLAVKVIKAPAGSDQLIPGTSKIALKRSVAHLAGGTLTASQAKAHSMLPGVSFLLIAKQLCLALAEDMLNLEDERLVEQLRSLRELLDKLPPK